jgi:hypothetical protein
VTVAVTILTGARPHLLADTLDSLTTYQPSLLAGNPVTVLLNGNDRDSFDVLHRHRDVIDRLHTTTEMAPIGPSISRLAVDAAESDADWWFHLEDDWRTVTSHDWTAQAVDILHQHPEVRQVRARSATERVMRRHRISRKPIRWKPRDGWNYSPHAHLTFNPSLIRTCHIPDGWPCTSEVDAMRRWLAAGHEGVAQLVPGVFEHTGHQSLRESLGRE